MRHKLFLSALILLFCSPVLLLIITGFAGVWRFPHLLPETWGVQAFRYLAGQSGSLAGALLHSLFYSILAAFCAFGVSFPVASLLARKTFRGKALLEAVLLAPALVPSVTFAVGAHYAMIKTGLADTTTGIVLILTTFSYPYMLRALVDGYHTFPESYELCAHNLGAGKLRRLLTLELPMLIPAVVAGGSVVFLVSFSEYFLVYLIGGGAVESFTGYLFPFLTSSNRQAASLLSLLFLVIPVLLFFLTDLTVGRIYRKRGMWDGSV